MNAPIPNPPTPSTRQPALNLPGVVTGLAALLLAIHAGRVFLLDDPANLQLIVNYAFIPARETAPEALGPFFPAPEAARIWTFITYAFLHADWGHVLMNDLWLVAFGAPVGWRFGPVRFLLYAGVGAVVGAGFHMLFAWNDVMPVIGASAGISTLMAGACRFAFVSGGPMWSRLGPAAYRMPAPSLAEIARDRRVLTFVGIWFAINIVFGLTNGAGLSSGTVAWGAHIGGFVAGLFLFPLFDPVRAPR